MSHATLPRLAGADIAARLGRGELFSDLAARVTGEEIVFAAQARSGASDLTAAEHKALRAGRESQGLRRLGELRTASGRLVARVASVYLPSRIPDLAVLHALWETDVPLGVALRPFGATRESLEAAAGEGDVAVRARGRLLVAGVPVALAEEEILADFALACWDAVPGC